MTYPAHGAVDLDPAGVVLDAEEAAAARVLHDAVANLAVVARVLVSRVHLADRKSTKHYTQSALNSAHVLTTKYQYTRVIHGVTS